MHTSISSPWLPIVMSIENWAILNQLTFYRHVRYFAVHLWSGCGPVLNQVLLDQI